MRNQILPLNIIVLGTLLTISSFATDTSRLILDTYQEFKTGETKSTMLDSEGFLKRARIQKELIKVPAEQLWSTLQVKDGFILGTAPNGRVFHIHKDGSKEIVEKFEEKYIYALAKNSKGEVFVGTSPNGRIYKLKGKERPVVYFEPKEKFIWAMQFDQNDNLYVGTGVGGKVYKVDTSGKGTLFFDSDETHMRSLAIEKSGAVLAGTSMSGFLYRIKAKDEGVVIATSDRSEINGITIGNDGAIYFSAVGVSSKKSKKRDTKEKKKAASKVQSELIKVDSSLFPQTLWKTQEIIFSIAYDKKNERVLAGTGSSGYLYAFDQRGRRSRLLKALAENLTGIIVMKNNNYLLSTNNPPLLVEAKAEKVEKGIYESDIIDSKFFVKWGAIHSRGKGVFSLKTRSGNTPSPDKSWYPWKATKNNQITSPSARFLQLEVQIEKGALDQLELYFLPKNLAPKISDLELLPAGVAFNLLPPTVEAPKTKNSKELLAKANVIGGNLNTLYWTGSTIKGFRYKPVKRKGWRTAVWKAQDPNADSLYFNIYYRNIEEEKFRLLEEDYRPKVYAWDTTGWPDGSYCLKIVATDKDDNPEGEELSDELKSAIFVVDNTPPSIRVSVNKLGKIEFSVRKDTGGLLHSVRVSKDGSEFKEVRPVDGILDSSFEVFNIKIAPDEMLFIRAEDQFGNITSASAKPSSN